jgi:hypothetical protein
LIFPFLSNINSTIAFAIDFLPFTHINKGEVAIVIIAAA